MREVMEFTNRKLKEIQKEAEYGSTTNAVALTICTSLYFFGHHVWALVGVGYFLSGFISWMAKMYQAKRLIQQGKAIVAKTTGKGEKDV